MTSYKCWADSPAFLHSLIRAPSTDRTVDIPGSKPEATLKRLTSVAPSEATRSRGILSNFKVSSSIPIFVNSSKTKLQKFDLPISTVLMIQELTSDTTWGVVTLRLYCEMNAAKLLYCSLEYRNRSSRRSPA